MRTHHHPPALRIAAVAALAAAALAIAPAAAGGPRFGAYVSCALHGSDHDTVCSLGATPSAIFRAFRRSGVRYKVCVRKPGGRVHCRVKRTRAAGARSRAAIALTRPGRYRVS